MVAIVREVCALLCGLLVASDYKLGQATIENNFFADNQRLFQTIFEVGRRHKIMNRVRTRYITRSNITGSNEEQPSEEQVQGLRGRLHLRAQPTQEHMQGLREIGRASCRERVCARV